MSWILFQSLWKLLFLINIGFLRKEKAIIGSLRALIIMAGHRSMTWQKLHMSYSNFSQPIIYSLNSSTKFTIVYCSIKTCLFSVSIQTCLFMLCYNFFYKNMSILSQNSNLSVYDYFLLERHFKRNCGSETKTFTRVSFDDGTGIYSIQHDWAM